MPARILLKLRFSARTAAFGDKISRRLAAECSARIFRVHLGFAQGRVDVRQPPLRRVCGDEGVKSVEPKRRRDAGDLLKFIACKRRIRTKKPRQRVSRARSPRRFARAEYVPLDTRDQLVRKFFKCAAPPPAKSRTPLNGDFAAHGLSLSPHCASLR